MKRFILLAILLAVVVITPGCQEPYVPDTTAYYRVAEIIRELEGDSAAQHFLDTHDSDKVVLIEDTIELSGIVELSSSGKTFKSKNQIASGLGQNFAYALRYGFCQPISQMLIAVSGGWPPVIVNMSIPVRTAGGRGTTNYVTVQSSRTMSDYTNVYGEKLYSSVKQYALQSDSFVVTLGDTLTINWSIYVGGTYSNDQKYSMAQGISPEIGYGGTIYKLLYGKFTTGSGFVTNGVKQYTGGDGNLLSLLCEWDYVHTGANDTITRFDVLNSNSDIVTSQTGLAIPVTAGDIVNAFHYVVFPTL